MHATPERCSCSTPATLLLRPARTIQLLVGVQAHPPHQTVSWGVIQRGVPLRAQGIRRVEAVTGQRAEAAIAQAEALSASVEHADTLQGAELEDKVKDLKKARLALALGFTSLQGTELEDKVKDLQRARLALGLGFISLQGTEPENKVKDLNPSSCLLHVGDGCDWPCGDAGAGQH